MQKILISTLLLTIGAIDYANALTCERYQMNTSGFKDKNTAESWYPKELYLDDAEFKPKPNSKQMIYRSETNMSGGASVVHMFYLLTNAKLISAVQARAGYKNPGEARYKCNLNSVQLKSKLATLSQNQNPDSKSSSPSENSPSREDQPPDMQKAITQCSNLGFTKGTEKHGECVLKLLSLNTSSLDLSRFTEFRKLLLMVDEETHQTFAAFRQNKVRANGILFLEGEVCNWTSQIIDSNKKLGKFDVNCPSGLEVNGQYNYQDAKSGSSGIGTDSRGRRVSYILQAQGSSSKSEIQNYFSKST